jgi:hypothetical protein
MGIIEEMRKELPFLVLAKQKQLSKEHQMLEGFYIDTVRNLKAHIQSKIKAAARVDFAFFCDLFSYLSEQTKNVMVVSFPKVDMGKKTFTTVSLFKFFEDIIINMMTESIIKSSGLDLNTIGQDQLTLLMTRVVD